MEISNVEVYKLRASLQGWDIRVTDQRGAKRKLLLLWAICIGNSTSIPVRRLGFLGMIAGRKTCVHRIVFPGLIK